MQNRVHQGAVVERAAIIRDLAVRLPESMTCAYAFENAAEVFSAVQAGMGCLLPGDRLTLIASDTQMECVVDTVNPLRFATEGSGRPRIFVFNRPEVFWISEQSGLRVQPAAGGWAIARRDRSGAWISRGDVYQTGEAAKSAALKQLPRVTGHPITVS